jgi:NADH:ubiquinone reductase (H+-translocating)
MADKPHHVVILGGGFGGLHAAQSLRRAPVRVTLIDRRNFHLFQPLLYQVAMGELSPSNIAAPLRDVLRKQKNAQVLLAEATGIDAANRQVLLSDGAIPYDTLIVATGATHHYFGHPDWEALAPGLKTIEDATEIRRRVLFAFEAAERETEPGRMRAWLTFVIVGGGPTGVELAGALAEIAHETLSSDFRNINPHDAQILLVEGLGRILGTYPEKLAAKATARLLKLGVSVRTNAFVSDVQRDSVSIRLGDSTEQIATRTVLWAAGVAASPLGKALERATGAPLDKAGRVIVQPDCSVPGYPNIFVIGDLASFSHQTGKPLPGVAQTAMQQGRYVARLIEQRLKGRAMPPFRYKDIGNMATIGRNSAVADLGWIRFGGFMAWLVWLFIHLMSLVQFHSRVLVLFQWGWKYVTRNRSSRLITGPNPLPVRD